MASRSNGTWELSNRASSSAYAAGAAARTARSCAGIEQQRLLVELIEHEHQHADEQHERLERNLPVGADEQRRARFVDRLRGEIALHLALVGAEVRQHEERAADHARPERVRVREAEREVEHAQPAGGARDVQRFDSARPESGRAA